MGGQLKFILSEKATKFCEIFTLLLTICTVVKSKVEDFAKFCGLLRIYEVYFPRVFKLQFSSFGSTNGQTINILTKTLRKL